MERTWGNIELNITGGGFKCIMTKPHMYRNNVLYHEKSY